VSEPDSRIFHIFDVRVGSTISSAVLLQACGADCGADSGVGRSVSRPQGELMKLSLLSTIKQYEDGFPQDAPRKRQGDDYRSLSLPLRTVITPPAFRIVVNREQRCGCLERTESKARESSGLRAYPDRNARRIRIFAERVARMMSCTRGKIARPA